MDNGAKEISLVTQFWEYMSSGGECDVQKDYKLLSKKVLMEPIPHAWFLVEGFGKVTLYYAWMDASDNVQVSQEAKFDVDDDAFYGHLDIIATTEELFKSIMRRLG